MTDPLIVHGRAHDAENPHCPHCTAGYPVPCLCGGLIHAEIDDLETTGMDESDYRCSICSREFRFLGEQKREGESLTLPLEV